MRKVKTVFFCLLLSSALYGIWNAWPTVRDTFVDVPQQTTVNMKWYKWEKNNITITTLDYGQGVRLAKNFDSIAAKYRPKDKKNMPIHLVAIDDKDTMQQLFGVNTSKVEIKDDRVHIFILWDKNVEAELSNES